MRTDSCRKCGGDLSVFKRCDTCQAPSVFECDDCKSISEPQIHSSCIAV